MPDLLSPPIGLLVWGELPSTTAGIVSDAAGSLGLRTTLSPPDGAPLVVLAPHVLAPQLWARWMRDDTVHLPVRLRGDGAVVGPRVVPGLTACLSCLALGARERDPGWAWRATREITARRRPPAPALVVEAALWAMRLLAAPVSAVSRSVELRGLSRPLESVHAPRAECGCRSP